MKVNFKKILAGVLGIGLTVMLLLFVNSFVGNPVSNAIAKRAAQRYIDANYAEQQLRIQACGYNFKFGAYLAFAQSEVSRDTAFGIYVDGFGNILQDDYAFEVANNFTTFRRLDEELQKRAEELVTGALEYDFENISLQFVKEGDLMALERDMKLNLHKPPLPLEADVTLFSDEVSHRRIAEVAKALEAVFREENIPVAQYSVRILPLSNKPQKESLAVSWVNSLAVSCFPAERMGEEDLPQAMERFEAEREAEMNAKGEK